MACVGRKATRNKNSHARAAKPHATRTHNQNEIYCVRSSFALEFFWSWFMSCLVSLVHLLNIQRARVISETTQRCTAYDSMTNGHQTNMSSRLYLNTVSYVLCSYITFPTSSSWHAKSPCHFGNQKPSLSLHLAVTSVGQRLFSVQYMILCLFGYGNIYRYIFFC